MKQKGKHISTIQAKKIALKDITKDSEVNYVYHEKEILKDIKENKLNYECIFKKKINRG